jgi:hypothetical protein
MIVDVSIYMNNIVKFFKENPEELLSLVPKDKENHFYERIEEIATLNAKNGDEVALTKKQLIDVCLELNNFSKSKTNGSIFQKTKFGEICLN